MSGLRLGTCRVGGRGSEPADADADLLLSGSGLKEMKRYLECSWMNWTTKGEGRTPTGHRLLRSIGLSGCKGREEPATRPVSACMSVCMYVCRWVMCVMRNGEVWWAAAIAVSGYE